MLSTARSRLASFAARAPSPSLLRPLSSSQFLSVSGPGTGENRIQANDPTPKKEIPNVSATNETAVDAMGAQDKALQESQADAEGKRQLQAPNRPGVWSRNQQERSVAMSGPRFEQTIMETQPRPYAAIDLIHKQPVRWVSTKSVACDGGGGPLGHPRIFINTDKPQICQCTYCGLPYANTHHRKHLESLPSNPYPLKSSGDPAEIQMPQSPTTFGEIQGQAPNLMGERIAESEDGQPYQQR